MVFRAKNDGTYPRLAIYVNEGLSIGITGPSPIGQSVFEMPLELQTKAGKQRFGKHGIIRPRIDHRIHFHEVATGGVAYFDGLPEGSHL